MSFLEIWGSFCSNDFEWRGMFRVIGDYKPTQTLAIFKISEQTTTLESPGFHLCEEKKNLPVHCETKETRILASKPSPWTLPGCIRVCFFRQKYTFPSSEQVFFLSLSSHFSLKMPQKLSQLRSLVLNQWLVKLLVDPPFYLNHFEWVC